MSPYQPSGGRSLVERLLGAAVCLLVAVVVLEWAVQVVERIAVPLLVIAGVAIAIGGLVRWLTYRNDGW